MSIVPVTYKNGCHLSIGYNDGQQMIAIKTDNTLIMQCSWDELKVRKISMSLAHFLHSVDAKLMPMSVRLYCSRHRY